MFCKISHDKFLEVLKKSLKFFENLFKGIIFLKSENV